MINKKNIAGDIIGREKIIKFIGKNKGKIIEIGPANRPLIEGVITVDFEPKWKPDYVANQDNLPFEDNSIDTIISSHCIEHCMNTRKTLREWFRVLKEGGKIAISMPHGEDVDWKTLGTSDMTHEQLYTVKTMELYLKHCGFKNIKVETYERPYAYKKTRGIFACGEKYEGDRFK